MIKIASRALKYSLRILTLFHFIQLGHSFFKILYPCKFLFFDKNLELASTKYAKQIEDDKSLTV